MSIESLEEKLKKLKPIENSSQEVMSYRNPAQAIEMAPIDVDGVLSKPVKSNSELSLAQSPTASRGGGTDANSPSTVYDFKTPVKLPDMPSKFRYNPPSNLNLPPRTVSSPETPVGGDSDLLARLEALRGRDTSAIDLIAMGLSTGIGAMYGQVGAGAKAAGQYGIQRARDAEKRQFDLEKAIIDLEQRRARQLAGNGGRRFKDINILKDGVTHKAVFDQVTGETRYLTIGDDTGTLVRTGYAVPPEESDRRVDYKSQTKIAEENHLGKGVRVDPRDGELVSVRDNQAIPVGGTPSGQFTKKQEEDAEKMRSEYIRSPGYNKAVGALQLAPGVTSLLDAAQRSNNPNSIAGSSVVLTLLRQAQGSGTITDADAERAGGTQQLMETISRLENKLLGSGESLTIRDIQELREISEIYERSARRTLGAYHEDSVKKFSNRYGFSRDQVEDQLAADISPYLNYSQTPVRASALPEGVTYQGQTFFPPKDQPKSTVPFLMDGKVYFTEPSLWDEVQRENPSARRLK